MSRLIIFIGIVLFTSFASTSVYAKEKTKLDETIEKYEAKQTELKDLESDLRLIEPIHADKLITLKTQKEAEEKTLKELKKTLNETQTQVLPSRSLLKALKIKLGSTTGQPARTNIKKNIETTKAELKKEEKTQAFNIETASSSVTVQKEKISEINKEINDNPITVAENKVATAKIELSSLSKTHSLLTLAYDTSSGFKVSEHLKASDSSDEVNITIVPDKQGDTHNIFYRIIRFMTQVIGTFAVLMLIVGGYFMITSKGDESRLTKGKNIFTNTLIGVIIAFLSYTAVTVILSILF